MPKVYIKFADEAVCIGPPPSNLSYLKMSNILLLQKSPMQMQYIQDTDSFLKILNFLKFVKNTVSNSLELPEMIDRMGDKASAKSTMIEAGVLVFRFCWNFRIIRTSLTIIKRFWLSSNA
jgi:acetyl-CoA carboxylase biotin carboxylase subunit